jgi:adenylate cyclase
MAQEIERKFLIANDAWRNGASGVHYRQGYLSTEPTRTVRVRLAGSRGYLTIKGKSSGAARLEYEYEIPAADANELLDLLCQRPLIEKVRYKITFAGMTWEVDEFEGENAGLLIAEVELQSEDQRVELPPWVGEEVTGDRRYYNASLIAQPFSSWND